MQYIYIYIYVVWYVFGCCAFLYLVVFTYSHIDKCIIFVRVLFVKFISVDRETPRHALATAHLPHHAQPRSSRTMSATEGTPSAPSVTESGGAGSVVAAGSSTTTVVKLSLLPRQPIIQWSTVSRRCFNPYKNKRNHDRQQQQAL